MKVKAFSFKVHTYDPRPISLSVVTHVYESKGGRLEKIELGEREFTEDADLLDFDSEFGDTFNISYNDLIHGEHSIKVYEGEATTALLLKVYKYHEEHSGKSGLLFRVIDEKGNSVYVDNVYFAVPLKNRVARIARLLGLPQSAIEEELRNIR